MTQKDYILRIAEDVGRALAQVLYHKEIRDYQGALTFIDELLKQTVGMSSGFIHSASEETVLSMLTLLGTLDVDKVFLVATLLNAEGDIYEDQGDPEAAYYSYLKSLNLFLGISLHDDNIHNLRSFPEVEDILDKLDEYDLPLNTQRLLLQYYGQIGG
jgi:hypothetical protein